MILKHLPPSCQVNVIKFGSAYQELFVCEQLLEEAGIKQKAEEFVQVIFLTFQVAVDLVCMYLVAILYRVLRQKYRTDKYSNRIF